MELQDIDRCDISSFVCAVELDTGTDTEELGAQKIIKNNVEISLDDLNVDQLRLLCRRLGITGASSAKRHACRALIAKLHVINSSAATRSEDPRSMEQQATNTLLRQINVIFSSEFIQRFQELNDGKTRVDHETGNVAKKFWHDVTLVYNDFAEIEEPVDARKLSIQNQFWEDVRKIKIDVSSPDKIKDTNSDLIDILDVAVNLPSANTKRAVGELLLAHAAKGNEGVVRKILAKFGWRASINATEAPLYFDEKIIIVNKANDPIIYDLIDEKAHDLCDVDVMTPVVYKKRINLLFRIRRQMKDNMTVSGTHDSEPWNYVDIAMNKIPGGGRLSKVRILYFYWRCEEFPDVDAAFQPFLDDNLKGSTAATSIKSNQEDKDSGETETERRLTKRAKEEKQRQEVYIAITGMSQFTAKLYDEVRKSNDDARRSNEEARRSNQIKQIKVEMELARILEDV